MALVGGRRLSVAETRVVPAHYDHTCIDCGLPGATSDDARCASCAWVIVDKMTPEEILALMPVAAEQPKDAA